MDIFDQVSAPAGGDIFDTVASEPVIPHTRTVTGVAVNPVSTKSRLGSGTQLLPTPKDIFDALPDAETVHEVAADVSRPAVALPKFTVNPDDSKIMAVVKSAANLGISLPEFMESPLGVATLGAGTVAPRAVAALFTADTGKNVTGQAKQMGSQWDAMTPAQKAAAITDISGNTLMTAALGHTAARGIPVTPAETALEPKPLPVQPPPAPRVQPVTPPAPPAEAASPAALAGLQTAMRQRQGEALKTPVAAPEPPAATLTPPPVKTPPIEATDAGKAIQTPSLPPMQTGEKMVTVQRADGTTYPAAVSGNTLDHPTRGEVPWVARLNQSGDAWSHGLLGADETILPQETAAPPSQKGGTPSEVSGVQAPALQTSPTSIVTVKGAAKPQIVKPKGEVKEPWEKAAAVVKPYAENLRTLSDKELKAEQKRTESELNQWGAGGKKDVFRDESGDRVLTEQDYHEDSQRMHAVDKEIERRKQSPPVSRAIPPASPATAPPEPVSPLIKAEGTGKSSAEPMRYFKPEVLEKQGYKPTGVTFKSDAGSWEQQRIAQQLNTPQESLTAFRMEDGTWKSYLKPGKKLGEGYVSEPMLPKSPAPSIPAEGGEDYRMEHRPNSEGPQAHDLLSTDLAPRDIYDRPDFYTGEPGSVGYRESVAALRKIRGKPDATVTIYRASPKNTLNEGDWVSFSKSYSKQHGMADDPSDDVPVHAFKVKAKDVRWAGDTLEEFGYYPEKPTPPAPAEKPAAASAKSKADKERLAKLAAKPLVGSSGDIGQRTLTGEGDLLSGDLSSGKLGNPQEGQTMGFGGVSKPKPIMPPPETPEELAEQQQVMTPGLEAVHNAHQGVLSLLMPTAKSADHLHAAETLGAKLGAMARRQEASAAQLAQSSKMFDKLGLDNPKLAPGDNPGIKFMSDMSQGRPMSPKMEAIGKLVEKQFDERTKALEEAGAPLQKVRENYFPGMWTRESRMAFNAAMEKLKFPEGFDINEATPEQKAAIKAQVDEFLTAGKGSEKDMLSYITKKPMKGKESFRKEKVFDDIMTGAEVGLRPISANPIDLVKGKLAEMDRSIMANQFFQHLKGEGKLEIISPYDEVPDGWVKVNDKYGTIYGAPTVTIPEHVDAAVYDGLVKFAQNIGVKHERSMKFPAGPGNRALGLSYQGQNFIRSKFATEMSVIAHEIGHQIDYKYDLWQNITGGEKGSERKSLIQKDLRTIADMTGDRGGKVRSKPEKIAQMVEAYVHAPDAMRKEAPTVFTLFDNFIRSKPELKPLSDIKPGIALKKLTGEKYVGLPIMGYRIVPKATGDVLNNYLSSSLYNNPYFGGIYKAWMATANVLNQSQLGLGSAFHAGFTTADVQISAGANLIKDLYGVARGNRSVSDLGNTVKDFVTATGRTAYQGDKVLNAWRNPDGVIDPKVAQIVKAAELAGGGFHMEHGMTTEQFVKMQRDWYSGNRIKAAARSPIAMTELMMKPIMEYLVPRQKAGVFADLAGRIIEQNPGKPLEELTPQFRQAWNRVDARLGQVRYNRLFVHNTAKNVAQAIIRAPGWSGGTIAEIGGALPDTSRFLREWARTGKLPADIPDRVAYTLSMFATMGVANAIATYAFTGQQPTGLDYLAFRTGRKDKNGNNERFMFPSYVKDVLAYERQPGTTLLNKSHPMFSMLGDLARNREYMGYEIRDPNAPAATQAGQVGKYVLKNFEPFWLRGQAATMPVGERASQFVGIMPAPSYINRSDIQNKIAELYHERTGDRLKPYSARDTDAAKKQAHDSSTMDVYMFRRLPKTDQAALRVKMTADERARYH